MCSCFCLWHCMALELQAWLAQSRACVQLRLGFRELQGGEFPGKKSSVTALRAFSWQVGFLASHPNSQDYFAWVLFCFGLFYAKVVCCKIHEHSWESSPQAAESSAHGMVVQRAGHSHLCLSAAGRKQAMSTDPSGEAWRGWRHLPSCSNSGVFGTPVEWHFTHISAQHSLSTSGTILDTILSPMLWAGTVGAVSQGLSGFQCLQGWRLHNLSEQPSPVSGYPLYSWSPVITWTSCVLPFYGSLLSGVLCSSMQALADIVFQTVGMDRSWV